MRYLILSLMWLGCRAPVVSAPVDAKQEELKQLLLSIPAECGGMAPLETIVCPAALPIPEGACVVERFDVPSERLISAHSRSHTTFRYDLSHRLTEKTVCLNAGPDAEWSPSWRPPMVEYDEPVTAQTRTAIWYAGDAGTPRFAQVDSTEGEGGHRMKYCYTYDAAGRRTRRFQTYRSQIPATLHVQVRSYSWASEKLASIDVRTLVLKGRSLENPGGWRVDFTYDEAGRLTESRSMNVSTRFRYDDRGRFVGVWANNFDLDDAGRLVGFHPEDPALDGTFEWDPSGRISRATFKTGDGYRVSYSPNCPTGFSPPPVTPSVEGFLLYEGKDEL